MDQFCAHQNTTSVHVSDSPLGSPTEWWKKSGEMYLLRAPLATRFAEWVGWYAASFQWVQVVVPKKCQEFWGSNSAIVKYRELKWSTWLCCWGFDRPYLWQSPGMRNISSLSGIYVKLIQLQWNLLSIPGRFQSFPILLFVLWGSHHFQRFFMEIGGIWAASKCSLKSIADLESKNI